MAKKVLARGRKGHSGDVDDGPAPSSWRYRAALPTYPAGSYRLASPGEQTAVAFANARGDMETLECQTRAVTCCPQSRVRLFVVEARTCQEAILVGFLCSGVGR